MRAGTGGPAAARFHGPYRSETLAAPGESAWASGLFSLFWSLAERPGPGTAGGRRLRLGLQDEALQSSAKWPSLFVSRHNRDSRLGQPPTLD